MILNLNLVTLSAFDKRVEIVELDEILLMDDVLIITITSTHKIPAKIHRWEKGVKMHPHPDINN